MKTLLILSAVLFLATLAYAGIYGPYSDTSYGGFGFGRPYSGKEKSDGYVPRPPQIGGYDYKSERSNFGGHGYGTKGYTHDIGGFGGVQGGLTRIEGKHYRPPFIRPPFISPPRINGFKGSGGRFGGYEGFFGGYGGGSGKSFGGYPPKILYG